MFVNHYSISTGMISSVAGAGAKYTNAYRDHTYRVDLPADPPARLFWSLTLYDAETAAEIDAEDQTYSSLNGMGDLAVNEDGSITVHVGPKRPPDAGNWIRTVPGRGWLALVRWYGPERAFFERRYRPGNFVRITAGSGR